MKFEKVLAERQNKIIYKDGDKTKGVTKNELQEWADLMGKEDRLIAGAMKKDKERYKDLK